MAARAEPKDGGSLLSFEPCLMSNLPEPVDPPKGLAPESTSSLRLPWSAQARGVDSAWGYMPDVLEALKVAARADLKDVDSRVAFEPCLEGPSMDYHHSSTGIPELEMPEQTPRWTVIHLDPKASWACKEGNGLASLQDTEATKRGHPGAPMAIGEVPLQMERLSSDDLCSPQATLTSMANAAIFGPVSEESDVAAFRACIDPKTDDLSLRRWLGNDSACLQTMDDWSTFRTDLLASAQKTLVSRHGEVEIDSPFNSSNFVFKQVDGKWLLHRLHTTGGDS